MKADYGLYNPSETLGQHLCRTLQAHWVMDDFLQTQIHQHPEVDPNITLYLLNIVILGWRWRL